MELSRILAFSGGKDSVAVSQFLLKNGYRFPHVAVINKELDYRCHLEFIESYCNQYDLPLIFINRKKHGMDFLRKNPKFIFPVSSARKSRWFRIFQRDGINDFAEKYRVKMIAYGRRLDDGNTIKSDRYQNANGIWQLFPLRSWSNEYTLDYIKRFPKSPIYNTPRGIRRGTHTINIANLYGENQFDDAINFIKATDENKYSKILELLKYREKFYGS